MRGHRSRPRKAESLPRLTNEIVRPRCGAAGVWVELRAFPCLLSVRLAHDWCCAGKNVLLSKKFESTHDDFAACYHLYSFAFIHS